MNFEARKLTLVSRGSNSEIYRYGDIAKGVVLKVVPSSCAKEAKHLANEYRVLGQLDHENIVKALKYRERINLSGTGQDK